MTARSVPPELLDPVIAYSRPLRIILFGSAARGESGTGQRYRSLGRPR
jgi:hypothetical protein